MKTPTLTLAASLLAVPLIGIGTLRAAPVPISDFGSFSESGNMLDSASHDREQQFVTSSGEITISQETAPTVGSAGQEMFGSGAFTNFLTADYRLEVKFTNWGGTGGGNERVGLLVASTVPAGGPESGDVRSSGDYFYWSVRNNSGFQAGVFTSGAVEETADTTAGLSGPLVADGSGNHKITGLYMQRTADGLSWDLGYMDLDGNDVFVQNRSTVNGETITADGSVIGFYSDMRADTSTFTFDDLRYGQVVAQDDDNDDLDDFWEDIHFGDGNGIPTPEELMICRGEQSGAASGGAIWDYDDDGADNLTEFIGYDNGSGSGFEQTDPDDNDSDDDMVLDGPEYDGSLNAAFFDEPTDPNDPDSDDDGLTDFEELVTYGTDPNFEFSDFDDLPDKWEVDNMLDPLVDTGDDGNEGDPDEDGLDNLGELDNGLNPQDPDFDDDLLLDGPELNATLNDLSTPTGFGATDPKDPDSDCDGLTDFEEVTGSPATDPNDADSDGDTFKDAVEIDEGTDPTSDASAPTGFIAVTNSVAGIQGPDGSSDPTTGVVFTSDSFDMMGGNAVVLVLTAEDIGSNNAEPPASLPSATFAGQPMIAVHAQDDTAGAQTASIFYLIDPTITEGVFEVTIDPGDTGFDYAYSQISLSGVPGVADMAVAELTAGQNSAATPVELSYATGSNDGFVIAAAVNNDFDGRAPISVDCGNPDTDLLPYFYFESPVGSSGHYHVSGRTGLAGDQVDGYLGQFQRTAIVSVAFGVAPPSVDPVKVVSAGFNESTGDFEVTYENLSTTSEYQFRRSSPGLDSFGDLGAPVMPPTSTFTFSDDSPPAGQAFYQLDLVE